MLYNFIAEHCRKYKNKGIAHPHHFIMHRQILKCNKCGAQLEKLTNEEELSGLLNLALISPMRLLSKRNLYSLLRKKRLERGIRDCQILLRRGLMIGVYLACNMRQINRKHIQILLIIDEIRG
jgi:hypothetical protein